MSAIINTNISAIAAQNSLRTSAMGQQQSMERLSSGLRINNAKDDAAGLAISTRMTANIRGIAAAVRNANDGISLTQTAEGSLAAIQDNLQRIRELAVQSANSSNTLTDRAALNAEASQLVSEIDRVASNTTFNGIYLLDGTYQNQSFQVGAGNTSNDQLTISIASAKASALGVGSGSSYATTVTSAAPDGTGLALGALTINGFAVGATVTDGVSSTGATGSGIAIANAINGITGQTGVTATVRENTVTGTAASAFTAITAGDIKVNGVSLGAIAAASGAVGTKPTERAAQVASAVNAVSSQTGVTASFTTAGVLTLKASDGRNIDIELDGTNATAATTGLTDATTVSTVKLTSNGSSGITVAATTAGGLTGSGFTAGYTAATATAGAGVSSVDLTTLSGSQAALSTLDSAINTVTNSRASMGAYQNRLAAAITNLSNTTMNLQASRSRILDTDYAQETTNLAKAQIIQQAATAMLAQANQSSQSVLALLK